MRIERRPPQTPGATALPIGLMRFSDAFLDEIPAAPAQVSQVVGEGTYCLGQAQEPAGPRRHVGVLPVPRREVAAVPRR